MMQHRNMTDGYETRSLDLRGGLAHALHLFKPKKDANMLTTCATLLSSG